MFVEFSDGESGKRVLGRRSKVEHLVVKPGDAIEDMAIPSVGRIVETVRTTMQ